MSEFKFACPVCGQHITAGSAASGSHIECPTCFQKIVVPAAPASTDTKFILSTRKAGAPRATEFPTSDLAPLVRRPPSTVPLTVLLIVLMVGVSAAVYAFRDRLFPIHEPAPPPAADPPTPKPTHPSVANSRWTTNLATVRIPDKPVAGAVHGSPFLHEIATFQWGILSLRQGSNWPPVLGVTIVLPIKPVEDYTNRTIQLLPEGVPPGHRSVLWWRDETQKAQSQQFTGGYALKLEFGSPSSNRLPGRIYLSLPDADASFVTGTFEAEIRKTRPGQRRPPPPRPPPPPPPTNNPAGPA